MQNKINIEYQLNEKEKGEVKKVLISGDFDNWVGKHELLKKYKEEKDDIYYEIDLEVGNIKKLLFKFIVDGVWKVCPNYDIEMTNDGIPNNVLFRNDSQNVLTSIDQNNDDTTSFDLLQEPKEKENIVPKDDSRATTPSCFKFSFQLDELLKDIMDIGKKLDGKPNEEEKDIPKVATPTYSYSQNEKEVESIKSNSIKVNSPLHTLKSKVSENSGVIEEKREKPKKKVRINQKDVDHKERKKAARKKKEREINKTKVIKKDTECEEKKNKEYEEMKYKECTKKKKGLISCKILEKLKKKFCKCK